jgi:hypothetical protein
MKKTFLAIILASLFVGASISESYSFSNKPGKHKVPKKTKRKKSAY